LLICNLYVKRGKHTREVPAASVLACSLELRIFDEVSRVIEEIRKHIARVIKVVANHRMRIQGAIVRRLRLLIDVLTGMAPSSNMPAREG
jgi:hypothetical protein